MTSMSRTLVLAFGVFMSVILPPSVSLPAEETVSPALTVSTIKPQTLEWAQSIAANGWLAAWQEAVISTEISLKIIDIQVEVGSVVTKGDILVQLEQASVLADLHKQEAAVATAQANLKEAEANAARARQVKGTGAISDQQVNVYLIAEQTAKASLASEDAALESQRIKLGQTTIRAVDDGVISSSSATLGAITSAGSELFRLIRQRKVEWQAEIPAPYINSIHAGLKARIDVPDGTHVYGVVRSVAPTVSKDTGRAIVYVQIPYSDKAKAGFNVSGAIELDTTSALTVPESALVFNDGMNYVFTVDGEQRVTRHKIETGRRSEGRVEIISGIAPDAVVVQSGGAFLSDGSKVKVVAAEEASR